jgi:hypothetical protein
MNVLIGRVGSPVIRQISITELFGSSLGQIHEIVTDLFMALLS